METTQADKFGIEIETVGLSRDAVARAVHSVVGGHLGFGAVVTMEDGREWKVVHDGSLSGHMNGEIVSPILTYADLDMLQNIVRAVREAGARADRSCGVHIHVDGSRFDVRGLLNLINMVHKNERLIERALDIRADRLNHYTRAIDANLVARLEQRRPRTMPELQAAWYGDRYHSPSRYDSTRYHGLNLNSFFYRGTIEFRYFNGTLHAGEIKSYVQLCLALAQRARNAKATSRARRQIATEHERWAFRLLLKTMGMLGEEFKTARHHLTKHLSGNGSNPKRAQSRTAVAS